MHNLPLLSRTAKSTRRRAFLEPLEARQMLAGVPELLADLELGADSSFAGNFVDLGGETFFSAGTELWKTNGTTAGTVLVKDTGSGTGPTFIESLGEHNGSLVFARLDLGADSSFFATDDDQFELWKSDGTEGGTTLVHDFGIGSFTGASEGAYFASVDGVLSGSV